MAKRGKEIALQTPVDSQEEWEDLLSKEGLCVVDVYQSWCGLCTGMMGNFKKYRAEINDDLLHFYAAKADTIDALEKYRGRCEPCFLFYAGGSLVAVIRGANAPLILRTITEQLAQEHKVLDGNAERKNIKDTVIDQLEARDREKEDEEEEQEAHRMNFQGEIIDYGDELATPSEAKKEVSVVIIKPDAVQSGQAEAILEEMKAQGIEVLCQEERVLTEDEVKNVYIHLQDEPFFEELVGYMTSSKSIVLAITKGKTGQNVINEFRELMGPMEVEQAKEKKPESLRAKFGTNNYMNAVHGSDSADTAARELAFFFPDFVAPPVDGEPKVQRTLALIRPDAYKNHKEEVIAKIREAGFKIAMSKEIHLDKAQAEEFYKEHQGQEYFDELTTRMSSGPLLALGLAREDAVSGWRHMLGPTKVEEAKEQQPESLRAQFVEEGASINMLHGSDSEDAAKKELQFFFPIEQTVAVIKPDAYGTRSEIIDKIHESGFRIAAQKETTLSREIAEEFYADHQDKEYFNDLVEHMVSGPTMFMVLSREDAVDGWRSLIGPTDPEEAKQANPDSLRGKFGSDKLKNAIHGSSTKDHAMTTITKIFGDLYFNADGTVREDNEEGTPELTVTTVPSICPDALEEAISEQQQINYEVAPEHGGGQEDSQAQQGEQKEGETTQEQDKQDQKQEAVEKTEGEVEKTEGEGQQQSEGKPSEGESEQKQEDQTPTEQKQEEEKKPADEGQAEQQEQKPAETEPKADEPKQEEAPAEKKQEEAEQKPEEANPAEQKPEEAKPAEQKQEEATPAEQKPEDAAPAEQKQEEGKQQEETKEADAKPSEEKKEGDN